LVDASSSIRSTSLSTLPTSESASPDSNTELWKTYSTRNGSYDEMLDGMGNARSHWHEFARSVQEIGSAEMFRRWSEVQQLIHENGITYNVYGDPGGLDRPWQLDPIPLLIASEEAAVLEAGLVQRANLLEKILADLYGPQTILKDGLFPAELVFGNPRFLRALHGARLPANRHLFLYAVDVGRTNSGQFWAVSDRVQNPSGAGYALENRIVLSRMLPETFRECRVQRLALFFRTLRDTLRAIAPRNRDNPRIVVLTPGPYNETYFEHAYLARYLGYTLAEGGDLTVRDNQVFLKLLGGLQPVDVIFRRLDEDFCDPLELRPDSFLGVPGLVQAVRSGSVAVANSLGSGILESPALPAFLPALCRRFLGEDLKLPSVPTWWCGDPNSLSHIIHNLPKMVVKPVFPSAKREAIFCNRLSAPDLQQLASRIQAKPRDYVGQELIHLSTTPVLVGERLQPRQMVLRMYLAASGDSFIAMPGGLTRVSASADTLEVSMQRGGGSKDTWVLSSGPVSTFSLLPRAGRSIELSRGGGDLPSRVADNLFWLGRYAERAESFTRLLRGTVVRITEKAGLGETPELPVLLRAVTSISHCFPGFLGEGAEARLAHPEPELLALVFDDRRSGSLAAILDVLRHVAAMVRDRISIDMWRILSNLEAKVDFHPPNPGNRRLEAHGFSRDRNGKSSLHLGVPMGEVLDLLNRTIASLAAFGGLATESMTRGQAWRFLDMGRKLERALHQVSLLRTTLTTVSPNESPLLEALLEINDSSMTYRRRYLGQVEAAAVLDLLLADESNPRSLVFQLGALADNVDRLPRDPELAIRSVEQRLMLQSLTSLRLIDIEQLATVDQSSTRPFLRGMMDHLSAELPSLSDLITESYLSHLQTARHLAGRPV
jgi:uncharacterized circularly permuted ATP-grasp superfamily protein/uncharacterized alpha-E superfamily protein